MKKQELLKGLTEKVDGLTQKKADEILKALAEVITEELANGGEVVIPDIVKLGTKVRAGRIGVNPKTQEKIEIAEKVVPTAKFTKTLKDIVAK